MLLIILGIVLAAIGMAGAIHNVATGGARMMRSGFNGDLDDSFESFGSTFKRQALWGTLLVLGIALALIGLVLVLV